ncbi:hypothetical protein BSL78_29456 [Apostichopus japonicus]|uniref:Uncharacterized protein n=1 Tax=Stichopus japonicus TaxID=307972 RepID=A0A2G8JDA4_STIJA|nr:hypothetical protein BSL78_29456 [Apostichopus japonicus]
MELQSRGFKELWFYRCKLPTSISPEMIPETARSRNIKGRRHPDYYRVCSNCRHHNESSQESQKSTIELLKKASRHDIPIYGVGLDESFNKIDEDVITLYSGLSLPIITSIEKMGISTEKGREMNKHEVNGILNYVQHSQRFKRLGFRFCLLPPTIASSSLANLKARNVNGLWVRFQLSHYVVSLARHFYLDSPLLQVYKWVPVRLKGPEAHDDPSGASLTGTLTQL